MLPDNLIFLSEMVCSSNYYHKTNSIPFSVVKQQFFHIYTIYDELYKYLRISFLPDILYYRTVYAHITLPMVQHIVEHNSHSYKFYSAPLYYQLLNFPKINLLKKKMLHPFLFQIHK